MNKPFDIFLKMRFYMNTFNNCFLGAYFEGLMLEGFIWVFM